MVPGKVEDGLAFPAARPLRDTPAMTPMITANGFEMDSNTELLTLKASTTPTVTEH